MAASFSKNESFERKKQTINNLFLKPQRAPSGRRMQPEKRKSSRRGVSVVVPPRTNSYRRRRQNLLHTEGVNVANYVVSPPPPQRPHRPGDLNKLSQNSNATMPAMTNGASLNTLVPPPDALRRHSSPNVNDSEAVINNPPARRAPVRPMPELDEARVNAVRPHQQQAHHGAPHTPARPDFDAVYAPSREQIDAHLNTLQGLHNVNNAALDAHIHAVSVTPYATMEKSNQGRSLPTRVRSRRNGAKSPRGKQKNCEKCSLQKAVAKVTMSTGNVIKVCRSCFDNIPWSKQAQKHPDHPHAQAQSEQMQRLKQQLPVQQRSRESGGSVDSPQGTVYADLPMARLRAMELQQQQQEQHQEQQQAQQGVQSTNYGVLPVAALRRMERQQHENQLGVPQMPHLPKKRSSRRRAPPSNSNYGFIPKRVSSRRGYV